MDSSRYGLLSYSQEGEDILLKRIFEYRDIGSGGFYVDVGAHHPYRFSNTYFFYKLGWCGINIDATPNSMDAFNATRPNDINLEYAVSDKEEKLIYYIFNEPALNSFDKKLSLERAKISNYQIIAEKEINTRRLDSILEQRLDKNKEIDFMSIDVEGFDFNVLKSNNWDKYRPKVVLVEILKTDLDDILQNETYRFLKTKGYRCFAKTFGTFLFLRDDFFQIRFP